MGKKLDNLTISLDWYFDGQVKKY